MTDIGTRVLKIREALGMTQVEFAKTIGLKSAKSISMIECGTTGLTSTNAEAICAKHYVNKEYLLYEKGKIFSEEMLNNSISQKLNKLEPEKQSIVNKLIDFMLEENQTK